MASAGLHLGRAVTVETLAGGIASASRPMASSRAVTFDIVDDGRCAELMARFIVERPELWCEDIAET